VTKYLARKVKHLVEERGILPSTQPEIGRLLPDETIKRVKEFYLRDDISRPLPGSKDVVSVRENGQRVKNSKGLI